MTQTCIDKIVHAIQELAVTAWRVSLKYRQWYGLSGIWTVRKARHGIRHHLNDANSKRSEVTESSSAPSKDVMHYCQDHTIDSVYACQCAPG